MNGTYRVRIRNHEPDTLILWDFDVLGTEEAGEEVHVYFGSPEEAERAVAQFGALPPEFVPTQNWSAGWQAEWQPFPVGKRFWLCPAWVDADAPEGRIRLAMAPGNVFGGGDHPTTQLCLEWLEDLVKPGMCVADIGAGTGILTQAARALGAWAIGCDVDPESAGMVDYIGSADALAGGRFQLVVANIHIGVLGEIRDELLRITAPGAELLLSGYLAEQAAALEGLFPGFVFEERELDGWRAARMSPCRPRVV